MENTFTITCYGKTKRYPESKRESMKQEYMIGMLSSDGSEKDRYTNIFLDLERGAKVCSDCDHLL